MEYLVRLALPLRAESGWGLAGEGTGAYSMSQLPEQLGSAPLAEAHVEISNGLPTILEWFSVTGRSRLVQAAVKYCTHHKNPKARKACFSQRGEEKIVMCHNPTLAD
ncbi:hypothetical protein NDU88_004896 [Pleurodeles waltl]|uniref:Uncharacterized protein n=1 Tax=Pleurodeles waltl TaxID=8319 RepID=A0AAV7VHJ6_PLEWA|nr:hypothetical protein NDU88_004896 [Pleurodeles waltl]